MSTFRPYQQLIVTLVVTPVTTTTPGMPGTDMVLNKNATLQAVNLSALNANTPPMFCAVCIGDDPARAIRLCRGWVRGDGRFSYAAGIGWFGSIDTGDIQTTHLYVAAGNDTGSAQQVIMEAWSVPSQ